MLKGYMGHILNVDLSARTLVDEATSEEMARNLLGGYGIGARLLYSRMKPGADPMGPENVLGFMTGPLTGTPAIVGSRYGVFAKSPLTGGWGDANSGGFFGPHLRFAGYDGVLLSGISPEPVYLFIDDGVAELRDATFLWGKDTAETEDALLAIHGAGIRVAAIGQAGERQCLISGIINDRGRAAARSGLGAVMGSKRLKAIAVRGNQKVPIADPDAARALRTKYLKAMDGQQLLKKYGTCAGVAGNVIGGRMPVKNWLGEGESDFPNAAAISDESVIAHQVKKYACWQCPVGCGGHVRSENGPYAVENAHKPELETLGAFGAMCLNDNILSIIKANDLCNRYGLDTISTGVTIAFAMECYEKGLISQADTEGLELRWGNDAAVVQMVTRIALREGLGDVLADGVARAAQRIGGQAAEIAVHCGGQEASMMDSRFHTGLALGYKVDATPGRHLQVGSWLLQRPNDWRQSLGLQAGPQDRARYEGMGQTYKRTATILHVIQASGLCYFPWYFIDPVSVPEFLTAVTGEPYDLERCFEIGERIGQLRHAFGLREGWNPLAVEWSTRIAGIPPQTRGPLAGVVVDVDQLTRDFFAEMGWDTQTALPDPARLASLGLADVAADARSGALTRARPR